MPKSKKEKIFDAVFDTVLAGAAISSITVSEIAKRAGIGKGSVYMYFASKEQMMAEAVKYFVESTMERLWAFDIDENKGFAEVMKEFLHGHIAVMQKYSKMFYSTVSTEYFPQLTPDLKKILGDVMQALREKYQAKLSKMLELGAREGIIAKTHTPFEVLVVSQMFFSTAGHFAQKEIPLVSSDVDEYVSLVYDMAVKMLN